MSTHGYEWAVFSTYIKKAYTRLLAVSKPRAKKYWKENLDVTSGVVETMAERFAVNDGVIPPRFSSWTTCSNCGEMPVPEEFPRATEQCPWCHVDWKAASARLKSQYEEMLAIKSKLT